MTKYIPMTEFTQFVFDDPHLAEKVAPVLQAILQARTARLTDIARQMPGSEQANYRALERLLAQIDPPAVFQRLLPPGAPFVIGDPTEIPRPGAKKTSYVGTLKDGETRGFWLLMLATPLRGRALPCGFITYSSRTIADQATSRNLEHQRAFALLKELLGDRPLVLDREFSYEHLLQHLTEAHVSFVIRLNLGSHPPHFINHLDLPVNLSVPRGQKVLYLNVRYRGQVPVNLIGYWRKGFRQPLWVISNLEPREALAIYLERMKVEEMLRDLKSLLGLHKLMNKLQQRMEQLVALVLLAYTIGLVVGENLRDYLFPPPQPIEPTSPLPAAPADQATSAQPAAEPATETAPAPPQRRPGAWLLYSGLFLLLKYRLSLPLATLRRLAHQAIQAFLNALAPPVS